VGCHNGPQGAAGPSSPSSPRPGRTSAPPAGTVTKWDCVVCHMEGDPATGDTTAAHRNGVINLRDPDTGANIKAVNFGGTGAGAYTSNATDATFTQFSRNLGNATLEPEVQAIMINPVPQVPRLKRRAEHVGPGPGRDGGEAFGTTIAGATYTGAGVTANGVLGVSPTSTPPSRPPTPRTTR